MKRKLGNRGQVTIFILVAIMIVSVILIFFLWARPTYFSSSTTGVSGFEGCVKDALGNGITQLEGTAGFIQSDFSYAYMGENLTYLCYTNDFYKTCTVQVPFLKNAFDNRPGLLFQRDWNPQAG